MSKNKELMPVLENIGEYTIDYFIKDDQIKNFPIIGTALSALRFVGNISDRIFLSKLKAFIDNVEINSDWKNKYSDEEECNKISKKILYIVDSCDDDDKLKLIGKVFNKYVKQEINQMEFYYIADIITKSFFPYLKEIKEIDSNHRIKNDGTQYDIDVIAHLLSIGVLDYSGQTAVCLDKAGKVTSLPSEIVEMNACGQFIKQLFKEVT